MLSAFIFSWILPAPKKPAKVEEAIVVEDVPDDKLEEVYLSKEERYTLDNMEVVDDTTFRGVKRSVQVVIPFKLEEASLIVVGRVIRELAKKPAEKTFITYYLPGMDLDGTCWASTHFVPDLEVRINDWVQLQTDEDRPIVSRKAFLGDK